MLDLVLLLLVGLGLVDLLLATGLEVRVVVTTEVHELLLAHVHHVGADTVEEIERVGDEDEGAVPLLHVLLEPHTGLQIQMGCGVVEKKERGLDEEGLGEGDTHTPSTRHVLGLLVHGLLVETETSQNERGTGVEGGRVHGVDTLVQVLELGAVGTLLFEDSLGLLLHVGERLLGLLDDPLERTGGGLLGALVEQVDVDVFREGVLAGGDGLEESRLATAVLTEKTVAAAV